MHYVTIVTIVDRCDFSRVLERAAFLGATTASARLWGEQRAAALLAKHPEPDFFDPTVEVDVVPLAEGLPNGKA